MYRRVEIIDGESVEPVQFVGTYVLRWPKGLEPQAAFVEADGVEAKLEAAEALATALTPLAELGQHIGTNYDDGGIVASCGRLDGLPMQLRVGDARRAAAALRRWEAAK